MTNELLTIVNNGDSSDTVKVRKVREVLEAELRDHDFYGYLEYMQDDITETWARIHENKRLLEGGLLQWYMLECRIT